MLNLSSNKETILNELKDHKYNKYIVEYNKYILECNRYCMRVVQEVCRILLLLITQ